MLRYFQCEQNVLTNSMRTYTITALRVDQWEILAEFILDVDSGYKYAAHIQNDLLYISLFTDFARWKTICRFFFERW